MDFSEFKPGYSYPTKMRGMSAKELAADMKAGWNLGNSLESENNETYWGNPKTTKAMIDKIAKRGFTTLRVPVRWDNHYTDSNYTIMNDYMNRVETVINYGLSNDMYVIVNIHHNAIQTMVSTDQSTQNRAKNEFSIVWTQIANRFKNYGDKLIFEIINEPRCGEDWTGNSSYFEIVNIYNEVGRKAIRATGGNNAKRLIMLPTYCASSDLPKIQGWRSLSDDKMIAVSIHAYKPFNFAFEGNGHSTWNQYDDKELSDNFQNLDSYFLKKGFTVIVGEFGAVNKNNYNERVFYASKYTQVAKSLGIPCFWWDNNLYGQGAEQFGLFDRNKCEFTYGNIADAMINVYKGINPPNIPERPISNNTSKPSSPYADLFNGSNSASNWGQALSVLTMKSEGTFDTFSINPNGYFYVEYSGKQNEIELILQSWSGGENWAKVEPCESGQVNGHCFSKFDYNSCVGSFKTSDFYKIDKIYVGAKQSNITVFCFRYYYDKNNTSTNTNTNNSNTHHQEANKNNSPIISSSSLQLFKGSADSSNWGQAVSVMTTKNKGTFDSSMIKPNGYFYVEYSGRQMEIELILQSWSGGENWAKVDASEHGEINGHFYAKYSYNNCTSAFKTSDFIGKLDKVYVGAKNDSITVYMLYYCPS